MVWIDSRLCLALDRRVGCLDHGFALCFRRRLRLRRSVCDDCRLIRSTLLCLVRPICFMNVVLQVCGCLAVCRFWIGYDFVVGFWRIRLSPCVRAYWCWQSGYVLPCWCMRIGRVMRLWLVYEKLVLCRVLTVWFWIFESICVVYGCAGLWVCDENWALKICRLWMLDWWLLVRFWNCNGLLVIVVCVVCSWRIESITWIGLGEKLLSVKIAELAV